MTSNSTTDSPPRSETEATKHLFDNWFDPIEAGLRVGVDMSSNTHAINAHSI
jgi:hypothetical protein